MSKRGLRVGQAGGSRTALRRKEEGTSFDTPIRLNIELKPSSGAAGMGWGCLEYRWGGLLWGTKAYILIETAVGRTREVAQALRKVEGMISVDVVTGPYDIIALLEARDIAAVGDLVTDQVHFTGVRSDCHLHFRRYRLACGVGSDSELRLREHLHVPQRRRPWTFASLKRRRNFVRSSLSF